MIPKEVRISHIQHFRRFLERKAVLLIRVAKSDCKINQKPNMSSPMLKTLKHEILRVTNEMDFILILSIAERVTPGIGVVVFGTIQEELEKRFSDLWGLG